MVLSLQAWVCDTITRPPGQQYITSPHSADDGHLLVWSLVTGKLNQRAKPMSGPLNYVLWMHRPELPKSMFLITGGADGTVKLWGKLQGTVRHYLMSFPH